MTAFALFLQDKNFIIYKIVSFICVQLYAAEIVNIHYRPFARFTVVNVFLFIVIAS